MADYFHSAVRETRRDHNNLRAVKKLFLIPSSGHIRRSIAFRGCGREYGPHAANWLVLIARLSECFSECVPEWSFGVFPGWARRSFDIHCYGSHSDFNIEGGRFSAILIMDHNGRSFRVVDARYDGKAQWGNPTAISNYGGIFAGFQGAIKYDQPEQSYCGSARCNPVEGTPHSKLLPPKFALIGAVLFCLGWLGISRWYGHSVFGHFISWWSMALGGAVFLAAALPLISASLNRRSENVRVAWDTSLRRPGGICAAVRPQAHRYAAYLDGATRAFGHCSRSCGLRGTLRYRGIVCIMIQRSVCPRRLLGDAVD